MSGSHHCDGDPTPDIPTFTGVGFLPLCGEAAVHVLQSDLHFFVHFAVDRDNERLKLVSLIQTLVKVLIIIVSFCYLQALLRCILKLRLCIRVHHMHVQDAVHPPIPKVPDQKVALIFPGGFLGGFGLVCKAFLLRMAQP